MNRLASVSNQNATASYAMDAAGLITVISNNAAVWQYEYDANGNLATNIASGATSVYSVLN